MELKIRERLIIGIGVGLALMIGWYVAEGSLALGAAVVVACLVIATCRILNIVPDVWLAGLVLFGYLVGNRGFAQLHAPNLPLLPGEVALGFALGAQFWRWAKQRGAAVAPDAINLLLIAWLVVASIRLPMDLRTYHMVAARDFAIVYYALFFFCAQDWGSRPKERRFLERAICLGAALTAPAFWISSLWPNWTDTHLSLGGMPMLFVKSDVAGGFMAGAVFLFVDRFRHTRHVIHLIVAAVALLGVATSNSRAAAVALGVGMLWLLVLRQGAMLRLVGALVLAGLVGLAGHALFAGGPLGSTPLYRAYEAAASVVDFSSTRTYRSADLNDKPDNNQFRLVWWQTVVADTWEQNKWYGAGFGADLAKDFLRIYAMDSEEPFSARSPHNFLLSIFGRTGLLGLLIFLALLGAIARKTWRSGTQEAPSSGGVSALGWLLMAWSIFASACFGVVMEGPMGAAVFWTALGLANRSRPESPDQPEPLADAKTALNPALGGA